VRFGILSAQHISVAGSSQKAGVSDRGILVRDAQLMRAVVRGDRRAQLDLVKRLWPRVKRTARHMSPSAQEAEDLAQEAMLQIVRSARGFQAEGCLEAWADAITVRTILKRLKRFRRVRSIFVSTEVEAEDPESSAEADYLRRSRAECVSTLLHRLPPDQRMALVLKLAHGHSVAEVSEIMGRIIPSVRYLLREGRGKMGKLATRDKRVRELFYEGGS